MVRILDEKYIVVVVVEDVGVVDGHVEVVDVGIDVDNDIVVEEVVVVDLDWLHTVVVVVAT